MNNKKISKDILKQFAYVLNIAEDKLKELLRQYDNAQEELEKLIYYAYKNYDIEKTEEELNLNEIKKYGRTDKIDKAISNITKELNNTEALAITMLLKKAYNESLNRNIYVLENNLKINTGVAFMKIPKQVIQNVIEYPIEGLTFSERIWANQFKLKNNLKSCIVDGIVKGKNIRTLSKELQEKMDTGRDNCSRLLRDQVARVWDAGQQKAWEETGVVEQVIWISTLDGKTSDTCKNLDGEIFDLKDAPDCPAHVNCRSCKAPYFKSIIKTRFEQQNRQIIEYKNYEEWAKDNITEKNYKEQADFKSFIKNLFSNSTDSTKVMELNNLPKDDFDNITKIVSNAPPQFQQLFLKHADDIKFLDIEYKGTAKYSPKDKGIYINLKDDRNNTKGKGAYTTLFHEVGHLIDKEMKRPSTSSKLSENFKDAIISDVSKFIINAKESYNIQSEKELCDLISKELKRNNRGHSISDIFGGVTENKIVGRFRHETDYWQIKGALERETFAHFFEATIRNDEYKLINIKNIFENSYEIFLDMIRGE